jgi:NADH-quinone oxidoreductase subunit M
MNLPTLVLALPLAGFLVALLVPRSSPQGSRDLGLAIASDVRRIAGLARGFDRGRRASSSPWTCRGSPRPTFTYHVAADGVSLWLVLLSTFLTPICVLISWRSIRTA